MDASFKLLLPLIENSSDCLLVADENLLSSIDALANFNQLQILSNRFDVFQSCREHNLQCNFSDFEFEAFAGRQFDKIFYRVSKEKPVTNHVINQAYTFLGDQGQLYLAGEKSDGIKSYTSNGGKLFGHKATADKHGNQYLTALTRASSSDTGKLLDDKDYRQTRPIGTLNSGELSSKPGVFGWNKSDKGSAFLIDVTQQHLDLTPDHNRSLLDIGCGYGYLTLATKDWPGVTERWATDNNAAALQCCKANAEKWQMAINIFADDCATSVERQFDLILCNPPFHQGFDVDSDLTRKFLKQAHRLLRANGEALFVVNQFIGLEKLAQQHFGQVEVLDQAQGFKVVSLKR